MSLRERSSELLMSSPFSSEGESSSIGRLVAKSLISGCVAASVLAGPDMLVRQGPPTCLRPPAALALSEEQVMTRNHRNLWLLGHTSCY